MRQYIHRKTILNDECLSNLNFSADGSIEFPSHVRKTVKKQTLNLFMNLVSDIVRVKAIESANINQIKDIIKILEKKKQQKTLKDLVLLKYVFRNINFFISLDQKIGDVSDSIYSNLNYESYPANTQLFKIDDYPNKFYIILKGEVIFLSQRQEEEKPPQSSDLRNILRIRRMGTFFATAVAAQTLQKQDKESQQIESLQTQYPDMIFTKKLKQGQSFFETSLSFKRPPSGYTVVCTQDTDFASISQEDFLSFLQEYYFLQARDNIMFLSSLTLFQDWSDQSLFKLYYQIKQQRFKYNEFIFTEGQQAEYIYLVREGEIEIIKTQRKQKINIDIEPIIVSLLIPSKRENLTSTGKTLRLGLISVGEFFGFNETIEGGYRDCNAQCKSTIAEVYGISRQLFLDTFQNFPQTIETLKQQSILIEKSRGNRNILQDPVERETHQNVQMKFNLKINKSRGICRVTSNTKNIQEESFIRKIFHQPGTCTDKKFQMLNNLSSRQSISKVESAKKIYRQRPQSLSVRTNNPPRSFQTQRSKISETLSQFKKLREHYDQEKLTNTISIRSLTLSQRPYSQRGNSNISQYLCWDQ